MKFCCKSAYLLAVDTVVLSGTKISSAESVISKKKCLDCAKFR